MVHFQSVVVELVFRSPFLVSAMVWYVFSRRIAGSAPTSRRGSGALDNVVDLRDRLSCSRWSGSHSAIPPVQVLMNTL